MDRKTRRRAEALPPRSLNRQLRLLAASLGGRSAESWSKPEDPFIREKFTRAHSFARKLAKEYFEKYPKERYQTEVDSWRKLQSDNIEFTMKRLREPLKGAVRPVRPRFLISAPPAAFK